MAMQLVDSNPSIEQQMRDFAETLSEKDRLTCDGGGSNSARKYIFKHDLERLSDSIGLPIRVAHYPPYCSKYNPIERRLFPHLGRACSGLLFDTVKTVVQLMRRAATATGLRTTVNVIRRCYETGRNATNETTTADQVR